MRLVPPPCVVSALFACIVLLSNQAWALPTPAMSEAEMLKAADLVVEGEIIGVVLAKRWTGTTAGVDQGYEMGDFKSWVHVTKVLKGPSTVDDAVEIFTHAYKEGQWSRGGEFVYAETETAITPGNRVRFYLKWDPKLRRYERIHFNSGYIPLKRGKGKHPTKVGEPALAETREVSM